MESAVRLSPFVKFDPYNFVPVTRTPWAGALIGACKKRALPKPEHGWPARIGESWEVSTDAHFPSKVVGDDVFLNQLIERNPAFYLGPGLSAIFGSHCPLLLKWLNAQEPLSVQVHPQHDHPLLKPNECGKPESWLILDNPHQAGFVFLGFKDGLSKDQILAGLRQDRPRDVLHVVYPKVGDVIAIPPGCVHATGPGVLIAEPQYVLPAKSGKTWRLSDWRRFYNQAGEQDPLGKPRELHIDEAISAIDWDLPRGKELERLLIHNAAHREVFQANRYNPFPVQSFLTAGMYVYSPLVEEQFSLVTCWEGQLRLMHDSGETLSLVAGESGFISAGAGIIRIELSAVDAQFAPACAFFAFKM
jgi:mannose-6-phosphate isomerase class I